jgi:hypothetical protein
MMLLKYADYPHHCDGGCAEKNKARVLSDYPQTILANVLDLKQNPNRKRR